MTKYGVSPRIAEVSKPIGDAFLKRDHSNKVLNQLLDYLCLNFTTLDASNHHAILKLLLSQSELVKVQREMLFRYISMILSEQSYSPLEEPMKLQIHDQIADLLTSKKLGQPIRSLNDSLISDFKIILSSLPMSQCEYIYDCIAESISEDTGKHYNTKVKLKLIELILKNFNYKDNSEIVKTLAKSLVDSKYCK